MLGQNLLEGSIIYLSPWVLIFALPYLLYSIYAVYSCLAKYKLVYIGKKSFGSRKFGLIMTIFWFIHGIFSPLYFALVYEYLTLTPFRTNIDLITIILAILSLSLLIIYGIAGYHKPITDISRDYIAQRRSRLNTLQNAPETRTRTTVRARPHSRTKKTASTTIRPTPRGSSYTRTKTSTKVSKKTQPARITTTTGPKRTYDISKIKPKAGVLTVDDFKCIFCFKLPKLPEDENRAIIICPHCRHPAHIDEFKNWSNQSMLCSRCNQKIPENFIRNPETIPVNVYLKAMEALLK
jgi:hypothetical protein